MTVGGPAQFPFSPIWLEDQYNHVRWTRGQIDLPKDQLRWTIENLARRPDWGAARIVEELTRPRSLQQRLVPPGFRISEFAVQQVIDELFGRG